MTPEVAGKCPGVDVIAAGGRRAGLVVLDDADAPRCEVVEQLRTDADQRARSLYMRRFATEDDPALEVAERGPARGLATRQPSGDAPRA